MGEAVLDERELARRAQRKPGHLLRKTKQTAPDARRRPALEQNLFSIREHEPLRPLQRQGAFTPRRRQLGDAIGPARHAVPPYRAVPALRVASAYGRTEIHKRLRIGLHVVAWQEPLGVPPQAFLRSQIPRQDPPHVTVQNRGALAEREHGDRRRGRAPDAWQFLDGVSIKGKALARYLLRGFVKVAAAGVVAQAAPEPQHLILGGKRKRVHGGVFLQKPLVVRHDGGDLGLLQHDFR
jgi:hypothetical protein